MRALLDDLRLGSRSLRKRPGLVVLAVLTLGLGIGVSTTLYALFLPQLYEMPPVGEPDHLSLLFKVNPALGIERGRPAYAEALEGRAASRAFERVEAIGEGEATMAAGDDSRRVSTHRVGAGFFETVGVKPALGRAFLPDECSPVEKPVALISHSLWRVLFQQDPDVVGREAEIGDEPHTIVGVMPEGFWFYLQGIDVWLPGRASTRDLDWGIPVPVPGWEGKCLYVWFEAVIGDLSAAIEWAQLEGRPGDWENWWTNPEAKAYYFIGKDNIPFHAVIWPGELAGAGEEFAGIFAGLEGKPLVLPYDVPANEFIEHGRPEDFRQPQLGRMGSGFPLALRP